MKSESLVDQAVPRSPRSTPCKGRPRDEQAHQSILQVTRRLAAEKKSYGEISIEAISRGAHVAKTTIYRWWKTKNALVREACFEGRLVAPQTGNLKNDIQGLISQEAAIHQGPVTRGVLAGFVTEFIERYPDKKAIDEAPKRFLQLALEDVFDAARQRGNDLDHLDVSQITDQIEMTLYYICILRGQVFTPDMANKLLQQVLPAA